jgi:5,6,7,8-tetrahydromethanopterin hydro-lyase
MLIGEAFAGHGANGAHLTVLIGRKGGPVESAWATALATPRAGFVTSLAVVRPNLAVKPLTLFVNRTEVRDEAHERMTRGPAQAGVAAGVAAAISDELIPAEAIDEILLIATAWVDPAADDVASVHAHNHAATHDAILAAVRGEPRIEDVLAEADRPWNPFFRDPTGAG